MKYRVGREEVIYMNIIQCLGALIASVSKFRGRKTALSNKWQSRHLSHGAAAAAGGVGGAPEAHLRGVQFETAARSSQTIHETDRSSSGLPDRYVYITGHHSK